MKKRRFFVKKSSANGDGTQNRRKALPETFPEATFWVKSAFFIDFGEFLAPGRVPKWPKSGDRRLGFFEARRPGSHLGAKRLIRNSCLPSPVPKTSILYEKWSVVRPIFVSFFMPILVSLNQPNQPN